MKRVSVNSTKFVLGIAAIFCINIVILINTARSAGVANEAAPSLDSSYPTLKNRANQTPRIFWHNHILDPHFKIQEIEGSSDYFVTYLPNCANPKDHDEADYCQQKLSTNISRDALEFSKLQAWIALLSAFISGAGIFLSGWAAVVAGKAARAAADAVTAERAYLTYAGIYIGDAKDIFRGGRIIRNGTFISIKWKNTGRSPAKVISLRSDYKILIESNNIPIFNIDANENFSSSIIGPGDDSLSIDYFLGDVDAVLARSKNSMLFVYFKVEYSTPWSGDRTYHTEICARIYITGGKMEINGAIQDANIVRFLGPQNTFS